MSYESWKDEYTKQRAGQVAVAERDMRAAFHAGRYEASRNLTSRFEYWSDGMQTWLPLGVDQVERYLNTGERVRAVTVIEQTKK